MLHTILGDVYYFARQYEKAVLSYRMSIELDPRFASAHTDLARSLEALGRFDEARAAYETGRRLSGGIAGPSFGLAHLEAAAGNVTEARRILDELTTARAQRVVSAWGSARCTRALATSTRRIAGWRLPCRRRRRVSLLRCILDWIRFDRTRATGHSSAAWVSTMATCRIASRASFVLHDALDQPIASCGDHQHGPRGSKSKT